MNTHTLHLGGLDCASCAQRIESALLALNIVNNANIDSNTQILTIETSDIERVKSEITRIEPHIRVSENEEEIENTESLKREIGSILGLFVLFIIGVIMLYVPTVQGFFNQMTLGENFSRTLAFAVLLICYIFAGLEVFKATWRNVRNRIFFDENFLMFFATVAAICIGEVAEAVAVMLFFRFGEFLESIAINRSKRSINALLQIIPDIAHKKIHNDIIDIRPKELQKNDVILVKVGEKIPTDSVVIKGESFLDMRSINGEPAPMAIKSGDSVIAGAINTQSLLELRVERVFANSHLAKIQKLAKEASANKAKTEKTITKFARIYTPIVFALALCVGIIPPIFNGEWSEWIYRALVVMMISCPCALVIAVPLGYFAAIGRASAQGILFKGSIYLEALAEVKNIIFDKTGTLTQGVFEVIEVCENQGFSKENLLALAACAESLSNHPIAHCITKAMPKGISYTLENYEECAGQGIISKIKDENRIFTVCVGNERLMQQCGVKFKQISSPHSVVYVACEGVYAGYILIGDKLKPDIIKHLAKLKDLGIEHIGILSGDNYKSVESFAKKLHITSFRAELLPSQKAQALIDLKAQWSGKSAFVGDGINDALVLRASDVGISIETDFESNDISKESADVVLSGSNFTLLLQAMSLAKRTKSITWQNITFALVSKVALIVLGIMGFANMWLAVFGDVGVALIALFNATRVSKNKKLF